MDRKWPHLIPRRPLSFLFSVFTCLLVRKSKTKSLGVVVDVVVGKGGDKEVSVVVSVLVADRELVLESFLLDKFDQIFSVQVVLQELVSRALLYS